jgi:NAD(P)-dependent dehydrogenase (short-subunit alcohol dehydrogenase family)
MNTLRGKVALVTGAAAKRGMGHGVAVRFGGEGAAVVIVDKVAVPRTRFSEDKGWEGLRSVVRLHNFLDELFLQRLTRFNVSQIGA